MGTMIGCSVRIAVVLICQLCIRGIAKGRLFGCGSAGIVGGGYRRGRVRLGDDMNRLLFAKAIGLGLVFPSIELEPSWWEQFVETGLIENQSIFLTEPIDCSKTKAVAVIVRNCEIVLSEQCKGMWQSGEWMRLEMRDCQIWTHLAK
jgi:hypothetical protein